MKLGKTTVLLIISVVLAASGIIGYFIMGRGRNGDLASDTVKSEQGPSEVYVHVKGEVKNPGMYVLEYGKRVDDAIKAAGGPTEDADVNKVNLAQIVADEMEIIVPKIGDESLYQSGKVNINTAQSDELQTINGIGEATAEKIIKYRESIGGRFSSIEEIMNVDGIGQKKFEAMKDFIYVQ